MRTIDRTRAVVLQEAPPAQLPAPAERARILSQARILVTRQSANLPAVRSERKQSALALAADPRAKARAEPALPVGHRVRLQMFCSGTGIAYIGIGLEHNGEVQLIGSELPSAGNRGGSEAPVLRAYTYIGALREWNCPVCRAAPAGVEAFGCACACFSDVLHCGGRSSGNVYCACGGFGAPQFERVPSLAVRGHASPRTPVNPMRRGRSAFLLRRPPETPQPLLPRCLR
jgi:hypothetical protein